MATKTFTGIENGKIVVDSYSGEAAMPQFAQAWRQFSEADRLFDDVNQVLLRHNLETLDGYDTPFVWRKLTPEESEITDNEYSKYRDPWNGDMTLISEGQS